MFRSASEIDSALHRLGKRLLYFDCAPLTIVICGGSALHALGLCSRTTRDIDICAATSSLAAPLRGRGCPLPDDFMSAVAAVGQDLSMSPGWLNMAAGEVLDVYGPPVGFVQRLVMRDYGPALRAGFLSRFDQIHFKVLAAADPKAPERHMEDLEHRLQPAPEEITAAVDWLLSRPTSPWFRANIRNVVEALGYEDIARHISH